MYQRPMGSLPRTRPAPSAIRQQKAPEGYLTQICSAWLAPSHLWRLGQRQPLTAHAVGDRATASRHSNRPAGGGGGSSGRRSDSFTAAPQIQRRRPRPSPTQQQQQQQPSKQRTSGSSDSSAAAAPDPRLRRSTPSASASSSSSSGLPVDVGQELELECARLALEGKGVCLVAPSGFVVLVERTLPGERVRARVVAVKRGYAEARKLASLSPHRNAVQPPCPYFGPCGGCTLQSLQYESQLAEKQNQVEQTLRRVGRLGPSLDRLAAEATSAEAGAGDGGAAAAGGGGGVLPTEPCRDSFAYRNKVMFHFSSRCWMPQQGDTVAERPCLGLLRPGTADVVLPVVQHGCKLQDHESNALLARVEELVSEQGLLPYNDPSGQGTLKYLVIRSGRGIAFPSSGEAAGAEPGAAASKELMVVFGVTHGSAVKQLQPVAEALGREFSQLVSVVAQPVATPRQSPSRGTAAAAEGGVRQQRGGDRGARNKGDRHTDSRGRDAPTAAATGGGDGEDALSDDGDACDDSSGRGAETLLYGVPYIHDVVCGLTFRISPGSFFQTNSRQAEVLYDIVRQAAGLRSTDAVLDLYCGTGAIGLSLAADCRQVVGVEVRESAVEDARRNAALNGITNATFLCANIDVIQNRLLLGAAAAAEPLTSAAAPPPSEAAVAAPDVVIVDPARGGLSIDAAAFLSRCGTRRVVYVSCNTATQARDLDRLCNGPGAPFTLVSVRPVDMFPHTDHVETVAVLDRRTVMAAAATAS